MAEQYSIVSIYPIFFIHSSVDGRLGSFHVLLLQIMLQRTQGWSYLSKMVISLPSDEDADVELLDHVAVLFLFSEGPPY